MTAPGPQEIQRTPSGPCAGEQMGGRKWIRRKQNHDTTPENFPQQPPLSCENWMSVVMKPTLFLWALLALAGGSAIGQEPLTGNINVHDPSTMVKQGSN